MSETKVENRGAVAGQVDCLVRPHFEEWARSQGHHDLTRSELRRDWYGNSYTNDAWMAWQAATMRATDRVADLWAGCTTEAEGHGCVDIGASIRAGRLVDAA